MPWWRFLFWNAAGAVCWATAVGFYAGIVIAAGVVIGWLVIRFAHKRVERRL